MPRKLLAFTLLIAMGAFQLSCSSGEVVDSKAEPSIKSVDIGAGPYFRSSQITARVVGAKNSKKLAYQWMVNGKPKPAADAAEFSSADLNKGDLIQCEVTPLNGTLKGTPVKSKSAVMQGTLPQLLTVSIGGGPYYRGSNITSNVAVHDEDGDTMRLEYEWFVNEAPVAGADGPTLNGEQLVRGDQVRLRVVAIETGIPGGAGISPAAEPEQFAGNPVDSNLVTIQNTAPNPPSVKVYPPAAASGTLLWANVITDSTDADGDSVLYSFDWYKNGELQPFAESATTVPGEFVLGGDEWVVVVTPTDMLDEGWAGLAPGPIVMLAAGEKVGGAFHTCVRTASKAAMKCWGDDRYGQLGRGSVTGVPALLPVSVSPGGASNLDISRIALGHYHTCVLLSDATVRCWGKNDMGQLGRGTSTAYQTDFGGNVTVGYTVTNLVAGANHTCALTSTAQVLCWGGNADGQVGNNVDYNNKLSPVLANVAGVSQIAAGESSTCAVQSTGALRCWGYVAGRAINPTAVAGAASVYSTAAGSIAVGGTFACARSTANELHCWGSIIPGGTAPYDFTTTGAGAGTVSSSGTTLTFTDNQYFAVGSVITAAGLTRTIASGSGKVWLTSVAFSPVLPASTTFTYTYTIQAVTAGLSHVCVLTAVNGVKCLGGNQNGQLGTGNFTNISYLSGLTDVPNFQGGVKALAAGAIHTCAVKGDVATGQGGILYCWGDNTYGQLGNGSSGTKAMTPTATTGWASYVDGGDSNSCTVTNTGELRCWGDNSNKQLGNNSVISSFTPIPVMADVSNNLKAVSAVAVGRYHACAIMDNGALKCWGRGTEGQLGIAAPPATQGYPIQVGTNYAAVAAGSMHTCAITDTGAVNCWGRNTLGALGRGAGNRTSSNTPVAANIGAQKAIAIAAGIDYTCIATASGSMMCWGANASGQIGNGNTSTQDNPVTVTIAGQTVVSVAAHDAHTCAVTRSGLVYCWGNNSQGQLGVGNFSDYTTPQLVSLGGATGMAVVVGYTHSCALTTDGTVKCWGRNADGEIGDNTVTPRSTAVNVTGLTANVTSIGAGGSHACVITLGGLVKCWGRNEQGQLGNTASGNTFSLDALTPVQVSVDTTASAVGAGSGHTCDVVGGVVKCWGSNVAGQSGPSAASFQMTPISTGLGGASTVRGGNNHSCSLLASGAVRCWGDDTYGQLGSAGGSSSTPLDPGLGSISAIAAGGNHACAVNSSKGIQCWGAGASGQIGDANWSNRASPTGVYSLGNSGSYMLSTAGGDGHTCGLVGTAVRCWGQQETGELGNGQTANGTYETPIATSFGAAANIGAGDFNTCAAMTTNGAQCAGDQWGGAVGNNADNGGWQGTPQGVWNLPASVPTKIDGGYRHFCAVASGNLYCWGWNAEWQVGKAIVNNCNWGETASWSCCTSSCWCGCCAWAWSTCRSYGYLTPCERTPVLILTAGVTDVSTRDAHTCAIQSGVLKCWGRNSEGQMGNAGTGSPVASLYTSLVATVSAVAAGGGHTCAVQNSVLKCTGRNDHGELGDNTNTQRTSWTNTNLTDGFFTGAQVSQLTAGDHHTCALVGNPGTVYCWGGNWVGQLGDGTTSDRWRPVHVQDRFGGVLNYVTSIKASRYSTCAARSTGQTVCWGYDWEARLGNNENGWNNEAYPKDVWGYSSEVYTAGGVPNIVAGGSHTCYIVKLSGTDRGVRCFGANESGQLGDNSTSASNIQRNVLRWDGVRWVNAFTNVSSVASGAKHSCAVDAGVVKCWGNNEEGQLGNNSYTNASVPQTVNGSLAAYSVAAGGSHTCALLANPGAVKCWGRNGEGQLGNGTRTDSLVPIDATGVANAVAITAGRRHTCALISGGTIKCWGAGGNGQIGVDTSPLGYQSLAKDISFNSGTVWSSASLGAGHGCGIVAGAVKCWGVNQTGQVGDGSTKVEARTSPSQVAGMTAGALAVGTGEMHSCALVTISGVNVAKCWGDNTYGQIGDSSVVSTSFSPVAVSNLLGAPDKLTVGRLHTCVRVPSATNRLQCWGQNSVGQIGNGLYSAGPQLIEKVPVVVSTETAASVSNFASPTLSAMTFTSGNIGAVQVGDLVRDVSTGARGTVTATDVNVKTITLGSITGSFDGGAITTGLRAEATASTWTSATNIVSVITFKAVTGGPIAAIQVGDVFTDTTTGGQRLVTAVGASTLTLSASGGSIDGGAFKVMDGLKNVTSVVAGAYHTCAILTSKEIRCWGNNGFSQLGVDTSLSTSTPVAVPTFVLNSAGVKATSAAQLALGEFHTCVLRDSTWGLTCWGNDDYGQIGDSAGTGVNVIYAATGVSGLGSGVASISAGAAGSSTCAVLNTGEVRCWGSGSSGQLGNNSLYDQPTPVSASGINSGVTAVAVGSSTVCAIDAQNNLRCWGDNQSAQAGNLDPQTVMGIY